MRLVGSSVPHQGTVEVCVNEAWGTVCDNSWNYADADVVCGQLGYPSSGYISMMIGIEMFVRCKSKKQCLLWSRDRTCFIIQSLLYWL